MTAPHPTTRVADPAEGSGYPGTFVTIEGIDGAGKSTAMQAIRRGFRSLVETSEPSAFQTGEWVYEAIEGKTDVETAPLADFYLYMADRANHIENTIRPALRDGELVVSDRYADSTRAYQSVALEGCSTVSNPRGFIEETMKPWNLEPDLTVYLDVDPLTAVDRIEGEDKYEKLAFLEDVRDEYLALADRTDRIVKVDTNDLTRGEVGYHVTDIIAEHLEDD